MVIVIKISFTERSQVPDYYSIRIVGVAGIALKLTCHAQCSMHIVIKSHRTVKGEIQYSYFANCGLLTPPTLHIIHYQTKVFVWVGRLAGDRTRNQWQTQTAQCSGSQKTCYAKTISLINFISSTNLTKRKTFDRNPKCSLEMKQFPL